MNKYYQGSNWGDKYYMRSDDTLKCPICSASCFPDYYNEHILMHASLHNLTNYFVSNSPALRTSSDLDTTCTLCATDHRSKDILEHLLTVHKADIMMHLITTATLPKIESEEELLASIEKLYDKLTKHGWSYDKAPAINADGRKGFIVTALEPQKKETTNVPERSESDRK